EHVDERHEVELGPTAATGLEAWAMHGEGGDETAVGPQASDAGAEFFSESNRVTSRSSSEANLSTRRCKTPPPISAGTAMTRPSTVAERARETPLVKRAGSGKPLGPPTLEKTRMSAQTV